MISNFLSSVGGLLNKNLTWMHSVFENESEGLFIEDAVNQDKN